MVVITLALYSLIASALSATSCSSSLAPAIVFPVTNMTLNDNIISRDAPISLGSPPQAFSFLPDGKAALNDVVVSSEHYSEQEWNITYVLTYLPLVALKVEGPTTAQNRMVALAMKRQA